MGYYDMPATIDYILNITKEAKVYYIGHSMGTTMLFVMASLRPEYNDKIRLGMALAPIAYLRNNRHQLLNTILPSSSRIAVCFNITLSISSQNKGKERENSSKN
jgi:Predicted hydrolases or acyltransferases (alpha/beta hydrolase superfamily)